MEDDVMGPDERPAGERLLEEDGIDPASGRDRRTALSEILEHERTVERRLRAAAVWAWGLTLGSAPLAGGTAVLIREGVPAGGEGLLRGLLVVLLVVAGLSLLAAVLASVGWISRSSAPALAAVDARLARLEELVHHRLRGEEREDV